MKHSSEQEFLNSTLGPRFYRLVQDYRQRQTDSIHAWLRDAVLITLLDPHPSGCNCRLHDLDDARPYDLAAALTRTVRDLVNEAAADGIDVVLLMRRHTPEQFGKFALQAPAFDEHLAEV